MKREWMNANEIKPVEKKKFDICLLDVGDKIIHGWWDGSGWDGLYYRGEPVKKWKWPDLCELHEISK